LRPGDENDGGFGPFIECQAEIPLRNELYPSDGASGWDDDEASTTLSRDVGGLEIRRIRWGKKISISRGRSRISTTPSRSPWSSERFSENAQIVVYYFSLSPSFLFSRLFSIHTSLSLVLVKKKTPQTMNSKTQIET
jgi:hypothetical protein